MEGGCLWGVSDGNRGLELALPGVHLCVSSERKPHVLTEPCLSPRPPVKSSRTPSGCDVDTQQCGSGAPLAAGQATGSEILERLVGRPRRRCLETRSLGRRRVL